MKKISMRSLLLVLVALLLVGFLANSGYAAEPIGQWHLDEGEGESTEDSSKGKNDGELMNGAEWVDGKLGKAVKFDGQDDCIQIPTEELPEEYTLSAYGCQLYVSMLKAA